MMLNENVWGYAKLVVWNKYHWNWVRLAHDGGYLWTKKQMDNGL